MMHFDWPWIFVLLPLPWLIRTLLPRAQGNSDAALHVPYLKDFQLSATSAAINSNLKRWPLFIYALLWLCLLSAASRPQWVGDAIELPVSGRDLMLAIDLSGSMGENFNNNYRSVSKLDATKAVAGDFIDKRVGDRIGLILFGDQAYMQAPLTFDRKTVRVLLNEAFVNLAGKATAIGDAIGLAIKRFVEKENNDDRVLILLTDGVNTAGELEPHKAAELAASKGMKIYTIGVGNQYTRARELDEKTLRDVAETTGGKYFRAHNIEELQQIYQLLDELEPVEKDRQSYRPTWALFYWPLSGAFFFAGLLALAKWRDAA
ncbi:MAG: VWA domain-containing protein [Gammaproteobacteria bacterium]|nr:VWA domain-containing protein [Gammaproteobacteria bacterium]